MVSDRRMVRWMALAIALAVAAAGLWAWSQYRRDLRAAVQRVEGRSELAATTWGAVEYRRVGTGVPVLVIHGSGGGFDQGELIAQALLPEGQAWIAPSRFGYLRSALPRGADFELQARVLDAWLQGLGLPRVHVVALSQGGPAALLMAARHPARVASLTLLSAGVTATADTGQAQASRQGDALAWVFQGNLRYWLLARLGRGPLLELMGVDAEVARGLGPAQRELVDAVIDRMHPAAPRAAGVRLDNRAALPGVQDLAAIRAPTLVVHARDDRLQVFGNAQAALRHIPGARLAAFDRGGHLLVAVERDAVRRLLAGHLGATATGPILSSR